MVLWLLHCKYNTLQRLNCLSFDIPLQHSHHYEPVVYQVDDDDDLLGEALSVPINIKLGSMGRGGERYNEISELHDQTREDIYL